MADPIVTKLRELLVIEWRRNHDRECPNNYEDETEEECKYPTLEILRDPIEGESECDYCGEPYMKKKSYQKFCSTDCRVADWQRWHKNKSTEEDAII